MPTQPAKPFSRTRKNVEDTEGDIRKLLKSYGATDYGYKEQGELSIIEFTFGGLTYRFAQVIPIRNDLESRRLWRVFFNTIKSDLIADAEGLVKVRERWLWNTVDPTNGQTFGEVIGPKLDELSRKALPAGDPS
jgi:hypothetical protein